jgi:hypothetical protein
VSKHIIIPDTQIKPGVPLDHLRWAGNYIVEKKPDTIVMIGDFADMPSLSSYDVGKKEFEGRRYVDDIEVAKEGMEMLLAPVNKEIKRLKNNKKKQWNPRKILTLGNHENRIDRAINSDRKLEGLISVEDLPFRSWEVIPFLLPISVDGIMYCHYFTSGVMGRPVGSARLLNNKKHCSCIMGHVQHKEIDIQYRADGSRITSIFAGAFYQHDEQYLGPQGNRHWRGIWVAHGVDNGVYDEMPVSIDYLKLKYS